MSGRSRARAAARVRRLRHWWTADALIVAIPDPLNAGAIIDTAKALNPNILVLARGLRDSDVEYLTEHGANRVILGVHEVADIMIDAVTPGGESITQG